DVVGLEQRQERVGLGVQVSGGSRGSKQQTDMGVVERVRRVETSFRVAAGVFQQEAVLVDERQPRPAVCQQPFQRRCTWSQWRRAEQERVLEGLLVLV